MTGKSLAAELLTGADAEKVGAARVAYKSLRELYHSKNSQTHGPRLIADLILSEEESPEIEMEAIVAEKEAIVPLLIGLLRSEEFYDPLFPGYGQAPTLAARCLGQIGDKRAMISLFEAIGEANFFSEDYLLDALQNIGEPAKEFLLKIVQSEPVNFDNERAAIALVRFKNDPDVAKCCLNVLSKPAVWKDPALAVHLVLACEGLKDPVDQQQFFDLTKNPSFPKILEQDIKLVSRSFGKP
jgi:HEAT repeat protein